ncbi:MAG: RecX family transcriptional regulator [Chloroflexota bacterium]
MVEELTITGITPQKKNKERVNVYLDGEFAFGLSLMTAVSLSIGQVLTPEKVNSLKAADEVERAKASAYRYLSYRPRSIAELKRQLGNKGFNEDTIDQVVDRLSELELIDDLAFARYWVEQRETFKPRGRRALRYELYQKGIDREIVDIVVADVDETESAKNAARKKARLWRELPEDQFYEKLSNYLGRRGFPYEIVRNVTQELWSSINHDNQLD